MKFERLKSGVIKRREVRLIGLFIDGTGLDRATRRIARKVDLSRLVRAICSGAKPVVARYYTLIPYEDDSRQRAFLDAVERAGLQVVVKRLPPKGVSRQVAVDVEMASDIVAFAMGKSDFISSEPIVEEVPSSGSALPSMVPFQTGARANGAITEVEVSLTDNTKVEEAAVDNPEKRVVIVVCPSRDIAYAISLARDIGVDTATADFGQFNQGDILKSAAKWIDLSDSESIWRE